ncbi:MULTISPECIES: LysR substrate-binding domain-containing protein [unclassified Streptomyces]|uniref:LysR substrate-binding domain-containing protein n=1 Tax=unclassified Streptomyces TaxID=2593676 RepID=UPI0003A6DDDE|nr:MULTISPECIES: LysR substrate-binding domain-containing protein [unclassified Streptomyces]EYT82255.1 LysR family transcriptional regulator [Streptomyces sp. Tu 6176]
MDIPRLLDGRLKMRHLLLVDALSRQGSVVAAAAELHTTQPAATRSLHELEDILGVPLFERGPRGVSATVFGEAFTQHARAVLAQLAQAGRHVVELAEADRGTVVVGTHLAGSNILLPRAVAGLKRDHPFLTVVVREASPEDLLLDLEAGRVDLIVGRLTASSGEGLIRLPLYDESIGLVVRAGHALTATPGAELTDTLGFPWILPGQQTVLRREVEELFALQGLGLPRNQVEATSFLTVRQLLLETDVVAVLPSSLVRDDSRLAELPVPLDRIGHRVGLTLSSDRTLSPSVQALMESLKAAAAGMTTGPPDPRGADRGPDERRDQSPR